MSSICWFIVAYYTHTLNSANAHLLLAGDPSIQFVDAQKIPSTDKWLLSRLSDAVLCGESSLFEPN